MLTPRLAILGLVASSLIGGNTFADENSQSPPKARVRIMATGGTIAGAQASQTEVGYKSGTFKVEDLIAAVPNLNKLATLTGEQVANIGSQDMNDQVWLKLAKRVNEVLKSDDVDAVVITHGTDTMEETAYFLNLAVKSDKPVVLVGSMRPATAVSADGPANLYDAVSVAIDPKAKGRGVLVAMNGKIHAARDVEKMNTTNVEAFGSPERGPQGLVNTGKVTWFDPSTKRHTAKSQFSVENLTQLPRVDILYAYSNMATDLIDTAVRDGAKGLVIAGVGDGNMTQQALTDLEKNVKERGLLVVRSSRLATGPVLRNAEVNDDKSGTVASGEFNPAKSRVLAMLALTETKDPRQVQQMFNTY
jgi:L-asparaginase